ncbi:MAG: TolC family protein [Prevotellaceae bacterium]|jgi:outer membrane protein TolC|nr:TolC family protein [Prevotellaceae bacterium]
MKKMKRKVIVLIIALCVCSSTFAQLSIEACYEKAESNYPLIKQHGLIEKSGYYNLSNIGKGYLPQIQFFAKATYQSEVTKIPIQMPGLEGLSKDQYGATLEINQSIWDGGSRKAQQKNVRTQTEVNRMNLNVTVYAVRERVNQLYFGILLHNEMLNQNTLYQEELKRNFTQISAYMQNGIANQADLDAVEVEQIKAIQSRTELSYSRKAYIEMLAVLIAEKIDENTQLIKPDINQPCSPDNQRLELSLYEAQFRDLDARKQEVYAGLRPQFNLFVTGGYSRPGLNMLENKFSAYCMGGISLIWNFGGLYTRKNKLNNIEVNRSMIESQRETFLFNSRLDITQNSNEIQKIREVLNSDNHIIRIRSSVKRSAETKVANGTLSVLELMKEVNAEQQAIQDRIVHEIELMQAIYNLKYITNN